MLPRYLYYIPIYRITCNISVCYSLVKTNDIRIALMEFPCLLFTDLEESEMIGSESQLQPWQSNSFLWWPNLSSLKWEYNCNLIESWGLNLMLYMKPLERIRHISIFSENGCHDCGGCYCQRNATVTPLLSFRAGSQAQSSWPLLHIALPSRCIQKQNGKHW